LNRDEGMGRMAGIFWREGLGKNGLPQANNPQPPYRGLFVSLHIIPYSDILGLLII
jgi:hypothetical protein